MRYFLTKEFSCQLGFLTERKKNGYSSLREDICNEILRYKNSEEAWQIRVNIRTIDKDVRLIKTEVRNTEQGLPKNNGYRLYLLVNKALNHVCFSYVHPKRGPFGQESISDMEEVDLVVTYAFQLESGTLIEVDINNKLALIKKESESNSDEIRSANNT